MKLVTDLNSIADNLQSIKDVTEGVFETSRSYGIPISFSPTMDKLVGGIREQTLIIVGGATGMGKSLFSLNIVRSLMVAGTKVFYADLENGAEETLERLSRMVYNLDDEYFSDPKNKEDFEKKLKGLTDFYYFGFQALNDMDYEHKGLDVLLKVMRMHVPLGYKVFFIDPLQALERETKGDNFVETGIVIKRLKEFAQINNVAVIVNHHIRKSVAGGGNYVEDISEVEPVKYRIPQLDDFKGTSKISDYATDVWAIVRTIGSSDLNSRGKTLFRVLKSRRKALGDVKLFLDFKTLTFREVTSFYDNIQQI